MMGIYRQQSLLTLFQPPAPPYKVLHAEAGCPPALLGVMTLIYLSRLTASIISAFHLSGRPLPMGSSRVAAYYRIERRYAG